MTMFDSLIPAVCNLTQYRQRSRSAEHPVHALAKDRAPSNAIPALPGFGFSSRPRTPWQVNPVDLVHSFMTDGLGYRRFLAVGSDIGAGIATRLALRHPDSVAGIHIGAVVDPPDIDEVTFTAAERAYRKQGQKWDEEGAYQHLQSTRPQTVGFALADLPVGLASWITEKFCFGAIMGAIPQRFYNVQQYSTPSRGGHFPAWEATDLYAEDILRFAHSLGGW
jgi:hypothetical protein